LPVGTNGFQVHVVDSCGEEFNYLINGQESIYLPDDTSKSKLYTELQQTSDFAAFAKWDGEDTEESFIIHCSYSFTVGPTTEFHKVYETNEPILFSMMIFVVFFFTTMVFVVYDCTVQRRQNTVLATAKRYDSIISSMFPKNVQQRIMEEAQEKSNQAVESKGYFGFAAKTNLHDFVKTGMEESEMAVKSKPIADLFPEATVMFADIVGFTAWSSTRDASQVFTLLETIFHEFDTIANRRRVFKVETVGDCYVAVAGLPEKRRDHAVVMARFARDILKKMNDVVRELESTLGPETGDLSIRIGLHSGPVTAGVLRGGMLSIEPQFSYSKSAARSCSFSQPPTPHRAKSISIVWR
jgi:hypothetical protein